MHNLIKSGVYGRVEHIEIVSELLKLLTMMLCD
jgi:hypothetical protein